MFFLEGVDKTDKVPRETQIKINARRVLASTRRVVETSIKLYYYVLNLLF
jgi:hypothetical protein